MWVFKYLVCLISGRHLWIGSNYKYCVRCGKMEAEHLHDCSTSQISFLNT